MDCTARESGHARQQRKPATQHEQQVIQSKTKHEIASRLRHTCKHRIAASHALGKEQAAVCANIAVAQNNGQHLQIHMQFQYPMGILHAVWPLSQPQTLYSGCRTCTQP